MDEKAKQYIKLKSLFEDNVLPKEHFEAAVNNLGISDTQLVMLGHHATIHGGIHFHSADPSKPSPEGILEKYRQKLIGSLQYIPLKGIDIQSSDPKGNRKPLELDRVYVGLDTTEHVEIDEKDKNKITKKIGEWTLKFGKNTRPLSALEVVESHRALVILGDPGSGKSTFVNHLAICVAREGTDTRACGTPSGCPENLKGFLPILVVIRDFAKWIPEGTNTGDARLLWDFILWRLTSDMMEDAGPHLKEALHEGRALVLLDGLDEISSKEKRKLVRESIEAFFNSNSQNRFLVTCRVLSYKNNDWQLNVTDFPAFELAPFDDEKIQTFIKSWYKDLLRIREIKTEEESLELTERLTRAAKRDDLRKMASNPLLLTVMALVHTHKGRLPDARALLYEECVDILLWRWDQNKSIEGQSKPRIQDLLLEAGRADVDLKQTIWRKAYNAHSKSKTTGTDTFPDHKEKDEALAGISEKDLVWAFGKLHPDESLDWAKKVIEAIRMRAGLLLEREPGLYTFPHRTFQEYLAGAHLFSQPGFAKTISELFDQDAYWREAILLSVGRIVYFSGDLEKALALVAELCPSEAGESEASWRKAWIAGEVLVEVGLNRVTDSELGRDLLKRLQGRLVRLLEKGILIPRERVAAGNALSILGDPRFDPDHWYLPTGDTMGFVTISDCSFEMGSDKKKDKDAREEEFPRHTVTLTGYKIAKYPVTVGAFRAFLKDSAYEPEDKSWEKYNEYHNHPVVQVSWNDAMAYCRWLTEKLKDRGVTVTLPTEAQWENAARGNDGRIWPCGDALDKDKANFGSVIGSTSPVGAFPEDISGFNCLDMTGNVWEWCQDWYGNDYYSKSPPHDPKGPNKGTDRVVRGGGWFIPAGLCRSAYRFRYQPGLRFNFLGFRLALLPGQQVSGQEKGAECGGD